MMLQADGAAPSVLAELRALFRASPVFATIQDMRGFAAATGCGCHLDTHNCRPISGVVAGNCVVLERRRHFLGPMFGVYCLGPDGFLMPLAGTFFATDQGALSFADSLSSDDKLALIAGSETNLHELGEDAVLQLTGGDTDSRLYKQHQIFQVAFMQWLQAQGSAAERSTSAKASHPIPRFGHVTL